MCTSQIDGRVMRVAHCELSAVDRTWPFVDLNARAIDAHWRLRSAGNPKFFDGRIHMLASYELTGDTLRGHCLETGFKEFLYWREHGEPETGVLDVFGSALIRSDEGCILLGRQRPGNINTGLAYLPGGFIDPRDVSGDGRIDIAASTAREAAEETGLDAEHLTRQPGYWLTFHGLQLSIAVEYQCRLPAMALKDRVMSHLEADPASELADVMLVQQPGDLDNLPMAPYARALLATLLTPFENI